MSTHPKTPLKALEQHLSKQSKQQLHTAKQLSIAAAICLLTIYALFLLTHRAAKRSEKAYLVQSLSKVLPPNSFDNDLLATRTENEDSVIYQACKNHTPRYQIYEIQTHKGYSGLIKLLASLDVDTQRIVQVRPLFHQETPGLGDQIEPEKSPWLTQFERPLSTPDSHIAVKQDGGEIDAITGATITSRAVSNTLRETLFATPLTTLPDACEKTQ